MTAEERADEAMHLMWRARQRIDSATEEGDPVQQRRFHVQAARFLREAADKLDDHGRLTE